MAKTDHPDTIGEYIAGFPVNIQRLLQQVYETVRETVPEAEEAIKYGMPTFIYHGNLVYFAAYKNHIGFYPAPVGNSRFEKALSPFKTGKGSVQFPLDRPIPLELIVKIVRWRKEENLRKTKPGRRTGNGG